MGLEMNNDMKTPFEYITFDPRPAALAAQTEAAKGKKILGLEVTVPALAQLCVVNYDPQHTRGVDMSCAMYVAQAMTNGTWDACRWQFDVLATVRADLDSVAAMAIVTLHSAMELFRIDRSRLILIDTADRFACGRWPGKKPLPSTKDGWGEQAGDASTHPELAAIAAAVSDFKVPLHKRVEWMIDWLETGAEPAGYRERVEAERAATIKALEDGDIKIVDYRQVCYVLSSHRGATMLGYRLAPVVLAEDPRFVFAGGPPHRKYTICAYQAQWCDMKAVLAELAELEAGWGGSATIIGSPQGAHSKLEPKQILKILLRHVL